MSKMQDLGPGKSKRHFSSKELRYSIGILVIISLASGLGLIVLAKALNSVVSPGLTPLIVMAGYGALVLLLTMGFSHRFIGPFQRLKMELKIILGGNYSGRLNIRQRDDVYIKSFIEEINLLLNEFEKMHVLKEDLIKTVNKDLEALSSRIGGQEMTKEDLLNVIECCRTKTRETLKKYKYKYERLTEETRGRMS